ncbi:MAG: DegV family protein [Clostridia bacterium]
MNEFEIITDNTADLYEGYYDENPTTRLCFPFTIAGKEYVKDQDFPLMDFYQTLKANNLIKTSQINQFEANEIFEKVLSAGRDLLYISFSSGMSGSYENISYVINGLKVKYPDRKIKIVDTLSGGGGEGLIVYYAKKMQKDGKSLDEIADWINENKRNVHHVFIVNDLVNLKHSGRISTLQALLGMIVSLKPVLEITRDGKVGVLSKALGRKKATQEIIRFFKEYYIADKNDFILIGHTGQLEEAQVLGSKIQEIEPNKEIKYCNINRLVAGNAGYGSLVVYFFGKVRMCK